MLPVPAPLALAAAQSVGLLVLFAVGVRWAAHTPYTPVRVGLGLAAIGAAMIALTIVLGAV